MVLAAVILFSGCALFYEPDIECRPVLEENQYVVDYVIDGDTLVAGGQRVRLLGINTPEEEEYYYQESTLALAAMVEEKVVVMQQDLTDRDRYGRLLRYIFLEDLFVNLELVERGFAHVYPFEPDVYYLDMLFEAQHRAKKRNLGLWKESNHQGIEIVLNYNAPGDDRFNLNGEYVKLINTTAEPINLTGWTIKDVATNIYQFPRFVLQPAKKVYIHSGEGQDTHKRLYWNSQTPVWNNDGDTLFLRDCSGALAGMFCY